MISIISGTSLRRVRVDVGRQHVEVAHVVDVQADELLDELVGA